VFHLQLDEHFRIQNNDSRNWILEKLETVKDRKSGEEKQEWKFRGFHGSLSYALERYTKEESILDRFDDKVTEVKDLISHMKNMEQIIKDTLKKENIDLSFVKNGRNDD
jgi:hypothetical protein